MFSEKILDYLPVPSKESPSKTHISFRNSTMINYFVWQQTLLCWTTISRSNFFILGIFLASSAVPYSGHHKLYSSFQTLQIASRSKPWKMICLYRHLSTEIGTGHGCFGLDPNNIYTFRFDFLLTMCRYHQNVNRGYFWNIR